MRPCASYVTSWSRNFAGSPEPVREQLVRNNAAIERSPCEAIHLGLTVDHPAFGAQPIGAR